VETGIQIQTSLDIFYKFMEEYLPVLQALQKADITYRVIGTWALKACFPIEMKHYQIHDCDLILLPSLENICRSIKILKQNNWVVTVWEQPVPADADATFFKGKFYIRGRQKSLVLDLIYECVIPWEDLVDIETLFLGIPLASVAHILALKRLKATEQKTLDAFQYLLNILGQGT